MAKSSVSDILAAQRAVQALDRKGRLAILNDLLKQDLHHGKYSPPPGPSAITPVTYEEGGES